MAEETPKTPDAAPGGRSKEEVALELMKFIAVQTGYGKGNSGGGAGFHGRTGVYTPEDYAASLLQLFERCRDVIGR